MQRRQLLRGIIGAVALGALPGAARAATAGSSPTTPVPFGGRAHVGAWTIAVHQQWVEWNDRDSDVVVWLAAQYHGAPPVQIFQHLNFALLGHDRRLHDLFDPPHSAYTPTHTWFETVTTGARIVGGMPFRSPALDVQHVDEVLFVVENRTPGRTETYTYFSLDELTRAR